MTEPGSLFVRDRPFIFRRCRNGDHNGCAGAALVSMGTYYGKVEDAVAYCECKCHDELREERGHEDNVGGR